MKKNNLCSILCLCFLIFIYCCKKNNDDDLADKLQYKVDGSFVSFPQTDNLSIPGHYGGILGIKDNGDVFALNFPFYTGIGTYVFNNRYNDTLCYASYVPDNANKGFISTNGTIVVTSFTPTFIQGTFSFSAINYTTNQTFNITDGVFRRNHAPI